MKSKRSHEGYLLIDHRNSPGVPDEVLRQVDPLLPPKAGHGVFEAPILTCSHCQVQVVVNPLRTRERAYCPKCDHYICDTCEGIRVQTGVCRTVQQMIDEQHEQTVKGGGLIITP